MPKPVTFIGRENELAAIRRLLLDFGTSRFLFISGDGGIGKTRLLRELRDRIELGRFEPDNLYANHRIALVQEFTDSEWSHEFYRGVEAMACELGVTLESTDAQYDPTRMAEQFAQQIDSRPDAIIVSLGSYTEVEAQIRRAIDLNIPVLTFDTHIESIEGKTVKVFQDDINGVQLVSTQMLKQINYRGKVAVIWTPENLLQQRRRSDLSRLLVNYNLVTVIDVHCEMSQHSCASAAEQIRVHIELHPDTQAVWCVFDEYARGVVQTLVKIDRTDIKVYSFDLCPSDRDLMRLEGSPWRATAAIDPSEAGRVMIRLALQHALGTSTHTSHYYSLPLKLVTQDDLRVGKLDDHTNWYGTEDIGWTPELHAIAAHIRAHAASLYTLSDVIDFADPDLVIEGNLEQRIANVTADTTLDTLALNLHQLTVQSRLLQTDATQRQREQVHRDLVSAINKRTHDQRLLLCFDTSERAGKELLDQDLIDMLCAFENTVVVFAGRPDGAMMERLTAQIECRKHPDAEILRLNLQPFDLTFSQQHLSEKQRMMPLQLSDDLTNTLALLSLGKPILLDLAIEYVFRKIQFDPLPDPQILAAMTSSQIKVAATTFESYLVQHIRRLRNRMDRMVLRLSLIAPLSVEAIAALFQTSSDDAQALFDEAKTYAFIREVSRYGGREIELHDEMKRLVETYLWEDFDPDGTQRCREHQRAVPFYLDQDRQLNKKIKDYEIQIADLDREISVLETQPLFDERRRDSLRAKQLRITIERSATRNRRYAVTEAWVFHMFESNDTRAFTDWIDIVDRVRGGKHYGFTLRLCQRIDVYKSRFSNDQQYEYQFRYARALLDTGKVEESTKQFESMLHGIARNEDRRSTIYNMLGTAYQRLGLLAKARNYQQRCLKLIDPEKKGTRASVLNQIGYCYRLQKDEKLNYWKLAQKCYEEVRTLATEARSETTGIEQRRYLRLIASTNNNLGYLYGLNRDYDRAETMINQAITIWRDMGEEAESARGEIALGILTRDRGYYAQSRRHIEQAIALLPTIDKSDMHYEAYFQLGWTEWFDAVDRTDAVSLAGLQLAERLLQHSLELAQEHEFRRAEPGIYHQLASVLWRLGRESGDATRCDEARRLNKVAIKLSSELNDYRYYVDSLLGEAEFDLDLDDDRHIAEYNSLLESYEQRRLIFPLYYGRMRRIRAEFALRHGDYQQAFELYASGIALINEHGGFGPYTVEKELRQLAQKLRQLSQAEAEQYLQLMLATWKEQTHKGSQINRYDLVFWCQNELQQTKLRIKA